MKKRRMQKYRKKKMQRVEFVHLMGSDCPIWTTSDNEMRKIRNAIQYKLAKVLNASQRLQCINDMLNFLLYQKRLAALPEFEREDVSYSVHFGHHPAMWVEYRKLDPEQAESLLTDHIGQCLDRQYQWSSYLDGYTDEKPALCATDIF
ncbi:hypothetical protein [Chitinivorax sp. B]|uniref:hypothetical protein n=1 Tax=Chitinivorax sp. B TaxID=2502235 RepID=UPI0010F8FC3D|nr:hypothetical protein [Chitinivorax sp. B]